MSKLHVSELVAGAESDKFKSIWTYFNSGNRVPGCLEFAEYMAFLLFDGTPSVDCVETIGEFEESQSALKSRFDQTQRGLLVQGWVEEKVSLSLDELFASLTAYEVIRQHAPILALDAILTVVFDGVQDTPPEQRQHQLSLRLAIYRTFIILLNECFCLQVIKPGDIPKEGFLTISPDNFNALDGISADDIDEWCAVAFRYVQTLSAK